MQDIRACVGCLATSVKMFSMRSRGLLEPYRLLTGIQLDDDMPEKLCWECAALVNKFCVFRHKCERAHRLLTDIYQRHGEISDKLIQQVDVVAHNLKSVYITKSLFNSDSLNSPDFDSGIIYEDRQNNDKTLLNNDKTKESRKRARSIDAKVKRREGRKKTKAAETNEPDVDMIVKDEKSEISEVSFESVNVPDVFGTNKSAIPELIKGEVDYIKEEPLSPANDCVDGWEEEETLKENRNRKKLEKKRHEKDLCVTIEPIMPEEARSVYLKRRDTTKFKSSKHSCELCYQAYRSGKLLAKHMMKHDPSRGEFECDACKTRFPTRKSLTAHVVVQHSRRYTCQLCGRIAYNKEKAKMHHNEHLRGVKKKKKVYKKRAKVPSAADFNTLQVTLTQEQMMSLVSERRNSEAYRRARFKCDHCYKLFNEDRAFANHMRQHDPMTGVFTCDICKLRYKTRRKLYKHISNNHMFRYTCQDCGHVCYNRASAQKHYSWHKGVVYTCHICGATSMKMSTHLSHLRIKHPSQHICGQCGQSFVSKMGLFHHTNKMHSEEPSSGSPGPYCAECDIQFSSTRVWTKHILISPRHERERATIKNGCHLCGSTFETAAELKRHHKSEHRRRGPSGNKRGGRLYPVQCAQCNELMVSESKYWQHFRQQHPGKPFPLTRSCFICEYCGNWFKHKSTLDMHAQSHQQKPQLQCARCPKKFLRPDALETHAGTHDEDGQHACDVCCRTFAHKRSLTNHFRTHTVERPHVCEWCGKSFAYDCNLRKHEASVHCANVASSSQHI